MIKFETWGGGTRDINGQIQLYINGTKIADHDNICTSNSSTPGFEFIEINGTIAQPAYDCPAHYRWWDGFLVTDNASNEINPYLSDPESNPPRTLFRP